MKSTFLASFLLLAILAKAQLPDTDIFLADIKNDHGIISFSTPVNITHRKGYDNQPYFTPDGKSILYVSVIDTTQSDVYRYDISSKKISRVTDTKESEYSPSLLADGKSISVVRVDKDSGQRFYNLDLKNPFKATVIHGTDSIGYYCWINDSILSMFILGNAMTLQTLNIHTGERKLVASDIGRCLKLSPDKKNLLFVIKQNETEWSLFRMDAVTSLMTKVVQTLKGSEDFAVLPDGTFLMGSDGKLFRYKPGSDKDWEPIADFTTTIQSFYRISVDSKGSRIAFVAYTGKKP